MSQLRFKNNNSKVYLALCENYENLKINLDNSELLHTGLKFSNMYTYRTKSIRFGAIKFLGIHF